MKDQSKASIGFPQRFSIHFVEGKHLSLRELSTINPDLKNALTEDVLYPLMRESILRESEVMQYIIKKNSEAYHLFETFHDELNIIKKKLSSTYVTGFDVICSYIGK